jgi:DNA-binding transcriptional ArsR family regulator
MSQALDQLLRGLRASADPSRLRLLAVLVSGEFTVSELTEILGQSQPRVSRHLKLLSDDGLLERFREQHWVYHRVPSEGDGAQLARALLQLLDRDDPLVALDRARAAAVLAARTAEAERSAGDLPALAPGAGQDLAELAVAELGERGFETVLYLGREPAEMLRAFGPRARRVVGVSDSRLEVQRARASLHGRGLAHCVLQHGDLRNVAAATASFDAVVLDRVLAGQAQPEPLLREAARVLRPGGQLMLVEDYEVLSERAAGSNPLGVLREWIAMAGLLCTRLRPVDVGAQHLLLAIAGHERAEAAA